MKSLYQNCKNDAIGKYSKMLDGSAFEVLLVNVPAEHRDRMMPDPKNPRIAHLVRGKHVTAKAVVNFLRQPEFKIDALVEQVILNQGVYETITCDTDGVILDGNRRWVADAIAREKGHDFPLLVEVFPPHVTAEQINSFLQLRHIGNQEDWNGRNRASNLFHSHYKLNIPVAKLEKTTGYSRKDIHRSINAFSDMIEYEKQYKDFDPENWSMFTNADNSLVYKDETQPEAKAWLWKLIYEDKVGRCTNIRKMDKLYANAKARKMAETKGMKAALDYLLPLLTRPDVFTEGEHLMSAIQNIGPKDKRAMEQDTPENLEGRAMLINVAAAIRNLLRDITPDVA